MDNRFVAVNLFNSIQFKLFMHIDTDCYFHFKHGVYITDNLL